MLDRVGPTTRIATLFAAAVLAAGCSSGSSDTTSPQSQFPGVYTLQSINGQGLPYVVQQAGAASVAITSDVYTFNTDGTFSEQTGESVTTPSGTTTQTLPRSGTWGLSGSTVTVTYSDDTTEMGTFSGGNTITASVDGLTGVYQK